MSSIDSSFDNEISLADLFRKLRTATHLIRVERRMLIIRMGLATIIGLFIAFGSPEEYSASMRLVPYRAAGGGGAAGLSGLAGLAGIRLPIGARDQIITEDLYPEVAKSLDFRITIAESPLRFSTLDRKVSAIEYFREIRRPSLIETIYSFLIGVPGRVISAHKMVDGNKRQELEFGPDSSTGITVVRQYDQAYLSFVEAIGSRLSIFKEKKTTILVISAKMPDRYAAADLVRVSAEKLMRQIAQYEAKKSSESFTFVENQYQLAKVRYERSQLQLAEFIDRNRTLVSATSQINRDRIERESDIAFEVYQQLSRELEQARIKMNQDTPVFTVLDQVMVPNVRTSPNRSQIVFFALLIGFFTGIAQLGIRQTAGSLNLTHLVQKTELKQ